MIVTTAQLEQFLSDCKNRKGRKVCAIDTEADSLHRHKESLCLIQFTAGEEAVLMDSLAIEDLSPLARYLTDATVWMHGADYDMTMLKRQFGQLPPTVYDTQIGARLLGIRQFGLGNLVEHFFGVLLSKSSQKADWGKRPLSPTMIEYALNDVVYLLEMGEKIVAQLKEKDRYEWFTESCEVALQKVSERNETKEDQWRISGSGKLEGYALACLKALWFWRDTEAEIWDKPSFMVATNRDLLEWSLKLAEKQELILPRHYRNDRIKRYKEAMDALQKLPKSEWPSKILIPRRKRDRDFDQLVDDMIAKRNAIAEELGIDGSLIISRSVIEALAAKEAEPEDLLMNWQRNLLGL